MQKLKAFKKMATKIKNNTSVYPDLCISDVYHDFGQIEGFRYNKKYDFKIFDKIWGKISNRKVACPDVEKWAIIKLMIDELTEDNNSDLELEEKQIVAFLSLFDFSTRNNICLNLDTNYSFEEESDYEAAIDLLLERKLIKIVGGKLCLVN